MNIKNKTITKTKHPYVYFSNNDRGEVGIGGGYDFDPIPRLQQIATTIREVGGIADIFASPASSAYDIECAIKEIERLRRDYSCICNEMRRMMEERDEARREVCSMNETGLRMNESDKKREAKRRGWDCYKDNTND